MANANVISFNDAVIQLQRLNKSAANQEKFAREDALTQKIMVGLDAQGNKEIQRQEEIEDKQEKHQSKMEESLIEIRNILGNISKSIEVALTSSIGGASNVGSALAKGSELTENESEAAKAKADADKEQHVLLNKLIEGISGLKKATDEGLTKLGATFKEGSAGGGGIMGGISSLLDAGKGLVGGGVKGIGGKIAGAARSGLGMISRAGPLAGIAGLGLAGFNVVNDVMGNIDQSNTVEENVKSGALTRSEGNVLQGEALGSTAGTAAGAAIGGIAGSALGPLGTAAGMWLGSKVGGFAGGVAGKYGVKAYQGIKGLFGFGESKQEEAAKMSPEQKLMQDYASGNINAEEYNKKMKLQTEGGSAAPVPTPTSASAAKEETYYDSNGVKLKKKASVSGKDLMTPVNSEVPPEVQAAVSANAGEQIVPASNIVATPTQQANTGGMWDSVKSMGKSVWGGIKSGASWVGDKASSIGKGISSWFSGTGLGRGIAQRGDDVSGGGVGTVSPDQKVGVNTNMSSTESSDGSSSRDFNQGITSEKTVLGSTWLGKMFAKKGTQTENFVASSESSSNDSTKMNEVYGSRKNGGWFGKDEYTLDGQKVDKDVYMRAKGVAATGGKLGDEVYGKSAETANAREDLANKNSGGTAVVNAPTTVNNTTQQANIMRSPFRNEEGSLNRYYNTRMGVY